MTKPPTKERSWEGHPYWYDCVVCIKLAYGETYRRKQGTLLAFNDLGALDNLNDMATSLWGGTIHRSTITEVDSNGEIVATTSSGGGKTDIIVPNTYTPKDYAAKKYEKQASPWDFGHNFNGRTTFPTFKLDALMEDRTNAEDRV